MSKLCTSCKKAIFDPLWGEYKCIAKQHVVYTMPLECSTYDPLLENEKVPISKDTYIYTDDQEE